MLKTAKKNKKVQKRIKDAAARSRTAQGNPPYRFIAPISSVVEEEYVITLTAKFSTREEGPIALCTCGEWSFGPSTKMMEIGKEAKKHAAETGHQLRSH